MANFERLARKIRQLYISNKSEWIRLAKLGIKQESRTKGPFCFLPERPLSLSEQIARLSCLHDIILKSSKPIIESCDKTGLDSDRAEVAYCYITMRLSVNNLNDSDITQLEVLYDDVAMHFHSNLAVGDGTNEKEIIEIKPSWFGVSIDIKEIWRRIWKKFKK
jgi:hypothetical protein